MKKALLAIVLSLGVFGCLDPFLVDYEANDFSFGGDRSRVSSARVVKTNFFIGQKMKGDEIIGASNEFYLDGNRRFTVFAEVPKDPDFERGGRLTFEMRNPANHVITVEHRPYNAKRATGIIFDASKLADTGGEGQWTVNFFADSSPLGRLEFGIYKDVAGASEAREELARELEGEKGGLKKSDYVVK